jgi:hypothetical protein
MTNHARRCVAGFLMMLCGLLAAGCGSDDSPATQAVVVDDGAGTHGFSTTADSGLRTVAYVEESARPDSSTTASKFDPIEVNGKFFEGWKKPKLALVISGVQDGYLEPCGCAGLENQKGGMSRRQTFLNQLRKQGWPVAAVDVGGLVHRFGKQAEIKFGIAAEALKKMHYSAVGFGPNDLRLSAGEIVAAVAGADPKDTIFVSANVNLFDLTPKVRIVEAGGLKLGITSVLGAEYQQQVNNAEVVISPAAEALAQVMGQLKGCDVRILLAHATTEESKALAKQFPAFDLVVTADGADTPKPQPDKIAGSKARLIEVGHKGMYVVVAGFYDDPKQPLRFQRVALDSRFSDSNEMKQLMAVYQDQLQQLGWDGLGLKRALHPRARKGDKLAGVFTSAANCKQCHAEAWEVWSKSKHAHATDSLTKADPPRQFDPECISCHATGWNPSEFFPFVSGFESLQKTPQLAGNSCDNCHGPGAAHVAAEKGNNQAQRAAQREALKLTIESARENVCVKCHDVDNSPEFHKADNFEKHYWPEVEH